MHGYRKQCGNWQWGVCVEERIVEINGDGKNKMF